MFVRIVIKNIILLKETKYSKEDFIKSIIEQGGVWDNIGIYFYPYHRIEKIEFRSEKDICFNSERKFLPSSTPIYGNDNRKR